MKITNTTKKVDFLKAIENGIYEIEAVQNGMYKISDNRFNKVTWELKKEDLGYSVSYRGAIDPFTVYFAMEQDEFDIVKATINGKTYKADKFLKKFSHVCILANCFINFGFCD